MKESQLNNPLHGITLEGVLNELVRHYGWDGLGQQIDIRCFNFEPSIASSLKFLRRTPWARTRVETLYVNLMKAQANHGSTPDKPL
ncbi:MAG: VF530 family DNA-binding protein [Thiobacillus sp.]|nr:VF530 family protein [Thiobacillus sp.]